MHQPRLGARRRTLWCFLNVKGPFPLEKRPFCHAECCHKKIAQNMNLRILMLSSSAAPSIEVIIEVPP